MAPQEVVGRYKLYKSKTRGFLYWLTKTAGSHCNLQDIIKSLSTSRSSRTKKKGENAAELEITTAEIVQLAQVVSAATVTVPRGILLIIKDVIQGRQQCAEWYSARASDQGEEEDDGHRHIISVLNQVYNILEPCSPELGGPEPAQTSKSKKTKSPQAGEDSLEGLFKCLNVEEPSLNPLGDEPLLVASNTRAGLVKVEFKLQQKKDDTAFKLWCLLQDLGEIRGFAQKAWQDYAKGGLTFLVASSITSSAISMLRRADEAFVKTNPQLRDWRAMVDFLNLDLFLSDHAVWFFSRATNAGQGHRMLNSDVNIVDLLCPIAFHTLEQYGKEAEIFRKTKRHSSTPPEPREILHELSHTLLRLVSSIESTYQLNKDNCFSEEDFLDGLMKICNTGRIPLWMVLAAQVHMDAYDMLGREVGRGADLMSETWKVVRATCEEFQAFLRGLNNLCTCDISSAVQGLRFLLQNADAWEKTFAQCDPDQSEEARREINPMCSLLPGIAGSLLLTIKTTMHQQATTLANHGCFVLSMAHLYRFLRATGVLASDWQDMDFAISAYGKKQPLVAKLNGPVVAKEAKNHYLLDLGLSIEDVKSTADKRKCSTEWCRANRSPRKICVDSPLFRALADRTASKRLTLGGSNGLVETIVEDLANKDEGEDKPRKVGAASRSRKKVTALQLLSVLKRKLVRDEALLNFDFMNFTISCWSLLDGITSQVADSMALESCGIDNRRTAVITVILLSGPRSELAVKAADALQAYIGGRGNFNAKKAFDQSSGRIPKDLRPRITADQEFMEMSTEVLRGALNRGNFKYSFSGPTMAAYHPKITLQDLDGSREDSGETGRGHPRDELPHDDGAESPRDMIGEINAHLECLPSVEAQFRHTKIRYCMHRFEHGEISEAQVQKQAMDIYGRHAVLLDISCLQNLIPWTAEAQKLWVFGNDPGEVQHKFALGLLLTALPLGEVLRPILEDCWLPVPVTATDSGASPTLFPDIFACAVMTLLTSVTKDPGLAWQCLQHNSIASSTAPCPTNTADVVATIFETIDDGASATDATDSKQ